LEPRFHLLTAGNIRAERGDAALVGDGHENDEEDLEADLDLRLVGVFPTGGFLDRFLPLGRGRAVDIGLPTRQREPVCAQAHSVKGDTKNRERTVLDKPGQSAGLIHGGIPRCFDQQRGAAAHGAVREAFSARVRLTELRRLVEDRNRFPALRTTQSDLPLSDFAAGQLLLQRRDERDGYFFLWVKGRKADPGPAAAFKAKDLKKRDVAGFDCPREKDHDNTAGAVLVGAIFLLWPMWVGESAAHIERQLVSVRHVPRRRGQVSPSPVTRAARSHPYALSTIHVPGTVFVPLRTIPT
jgi:hypothetical protein